MNKYKSTRKVFLPFLFLLFTFSIILSCNSQYKREKVVEYFRVTGHLLNACHYVPDKITHKGVVIIFEAEGGDMSLSLAKRGYEVLSVYYFGQENLPYECVEIPLEFFGEVLKYINTKCKKKKPITVIGGSKDAELAAVLVSYYPEIDNIVLYAPVSYVYQGYTAKNKSSWAWKGEPLPFIPLSPEAQLKAEFKYAVDIKSYYRVSRPVYEEAIKLASEETRKKAEIDISNFKGHCLIFAGADDCTWPSDTAAKALQAQNPERVQLHIFEKAGHGFTFNYVYFYFWKLGGTPEGNYKASIEHKKILYKFLDKQHPKK